MRSRAESLKDLVLLQGNIDLTLVKSGLASLEFSNSLNNRLKENCDTEETINKIKNISKCSNHRKRSC
jgi:hypothetical protein